MAIKVGTSGTVTKKVAVAGSNTLVKEVKVGTPVKRVTSGAFTLNSLGGVNVSNLQDGSLLVYNDATKEWDAEIELQKQTLNGGSY